jgi:hypothetical protein
LGRSKKEKIENNLSELDFYENQIRKENYDISSTNLLIFTKNLIQKIKQIEDVIIKMFKDSKQGNVESYLKEKEVVMNELFSDDNHILLKTIDDEEEFEDSSEYFRKAINRLFTRVINLVGNGIKGLNSNKDNIINNYGYFNEKRKKKVFVNCCFKDIIDEDDYSNSVTLYECNHNFCRSCLKKYIIFHTKNNVFLSYYDLESNKRVLKCKVKNCKFYITTADIKNIFSDDKIVEIIYDNFKIRILENKKLLDKFYDEHVNYYPCVVCGNIENRFERNLDCCNEVNIEDNLFYDNHVICYECLDVLSRNQFNYLNDKNINEKPKICCPMLSCNNFITDEIQKRINFLENEKKNELKIKDNNNKNLNIFISNYKSAKEEIEIKNQNLWNKFKDSDISNKNMIIPRKYILV